MLENERPHNISTSFVFIIVHFWISNSGEHSLTNTNTHITRLEKPTLYDNITQVTNHKNTSWHQTC
jgi:hypothetical protein